MRQLPIGASPLVCRYNPATRATRAIGPRGSRGWASQEGRSRRVAGGHRRRVAARAALPVAAVVGLFLGLPVGAGAQGGVPPLLTADTPPASIPQGVPFNYTFRASGSPAPAFAVDVGTLPVGLSLDGVSGTLSGTPTSAGVYG